MGLFCTFLVFRPNHVSLASSHCAQAGWKAQWMIDPSRRFKFHDMGMSEVSHPSALKDFGRLRDNEEHGSMLVLEGDQTHANNVVSLIGAAATVIEGFPRQGGWPTYSFELREEREDDQEKLFEGIFRKEGFFKMFAHHSELPTATALAARASQDAKTIYAIHKLAMSYETEAVTPWSTHPRYADIFDKHSYEYRSHVGTSIAINLAYSAIEELGLEVRSSFKKPRWVRSDTHEWNPEVLQELQERLRRSGIDPQEKGTWIVRGDQTEVPPHPIRNTLSAFSDGQKVRDIDYSLPDAISACSYLRNYLTAHAFSKDTPLLGPYEVFNTQQVARRLILGKCGLWKVFTEQLEAVRSGSQTVKQERDDGRPK